MAETLNMGGGKLFTKLVKDDGSLDVKRYFGKTDSITLSTKTDYVEHKDTEGKYASTDYKAIKEKTASLKFTTGEISGEMMALALSGEAVTTDVASGSVSGEAHGASESVGGAYVTLANHLVSNVEVHYDNGGTDTIAVEGTDYNVDTAENGMLYIIAGGAIDGKDITVNYDYAKATLSSIEALVKKAVVAQLEFYSEPQVGQKLHYTFYKVQLQQDGDIALKSIDNFIEISFNGEVLNTGNADTPFFKTELIKA
jgi:hypothetical protein